MHNYAHEIECPEDRAMRKFLWCDYFRDSEILSAQIEGEKQDCVRMLIRSDRDERAEWQKFRGEYEKWREYAEENKEKYVYILKFTHAVFFERTQTDCWRWSEYVNSRFKDTALLRRMQETSEKKLYHLRIQTSDGLIDLIFGGFEIRRLHGRVNYSMNVIAEPRGLGDFELEMAAEEVYNTLPKDDSERYRLVERMYYAGNPAAVWAARDCLDKRFPYEDAKPYAAHVLGKIGNMEDVSRLIELYFEAEKELMKIGHACAAAVLHKKNILDAVELIRYRADHRKGGKRSKAGAEKARKEKKPT